MNKNQKSIFLAGYLSSKRANPSPTNLLKEYFEQLGFKITCTTPYRNKYLRVMNMLLTLLLQIRNTEIVFIDVFSGNAFLWAEANGMICRAFRTPYVCMLHGGNLPEFSKQYTYRIFRLLKNAKKVIAPSDYLMKSLQHLGIHITTIPNSIVTARYEYKERSHLNPTLFWLRAFHHIYNPTMAIRVLSHLKKQYPGVRLTMAGPDKGEMENCKSLAKELGVLENVSFPGRIMKDKISRIAKEHDIFINTSDIDNAPVSIIEAMALGMPVVSTNAGGIPYIIENSKDGILVSPADDRGMSQAVIDLLSNDTMAASLSKNGRKKAEMFDVSIVLPQWQTLLSSVLEHQ